VETKKDVSASRLEEREERLEDPMRVRIGEEVEEGESQMPEEKMRKKEMG